MLHTVIYLRHFTSSKKKHRTEHILLLYKTLKISDKKYEIIPPTNRN